MSVEENINLESLELSKVSFYSKMNINDMLNSEFLKELNNVFGEVKGINLTLDCTGGEDKPPKLLSLSHKNSKNIEKKRLTVDFQYAGNSSDRDIKKIIALLIKQ
ncbi:hypothetical protein [Methanobrevibacter sp. UBA313]|uniref:hypothetical protein n=1 Tax=Methanobrevibacter sp. UBA313 TaxID=1915477 RepID=UPI0039B93CBB